MLRLIFHDDPNKGILILKSRIWKYTPFRLYRGFHDTAVNTNYALRDGTNAAPPTGCTTATRKFFFQVFVILAKMSRSLLSKKLKMIKSIKTWFAIFPVHPLSLKTHPLACIQTLNVCFSRCRDRLKPTLTSSKYNSLLLYLEIFLGNAILWAAVTTFILFF